MVGCDLIDCNMRHDCPPGTACYEQNHKPNKNDYIFLGLILSALLTGELYMLFTLSHEMTFVESAMLTSTTISIVISPLLLYYLRKK